MVGFALVRVGQNECHCILQRLMGFLNDGDSISFPITSRNLAMEYHFIQREGSITIDRFMLMETFI